jgi:anti-sigma factor RsiW
MNNTTHPDVQEAELHAWVDGQLPEARVAAVANWLQTHPSDAERVHTWQTQRQALQGLHRTVLDEPVPLAMARAIRPRHWWATALNRPWTQALAASLLLTVGFGSGWLLHPANTTLADGSVPAFVREARVAHVVYVPDKRHPVEVDAQQQAHLVQWLSRRLGTPLKAPMLDAQGFHLVGGRLLPGESGQARALFMYEDSQGTRVTLHVSALEADRPAPSGEFRFSRWGDTQTFYWVETTLGYALSGQIPRQQLAELASAAYPQLSP